jgi:hypothetical protein
VGLAPRRWCQVCEKERRRRWPTSPEHRGEHGVAVKTIARGMPGDSGVTCMLVCALPLSLHTRPRAHRAPGIPCALISRGREFLGKPRAQCVARSRRCVLNFVVPAKAGTHNPRRSWRRRAGSARPLAPPVSLTTRRMGPCFRRDNEGRRKPKPPPSRHGFPRAVRRSGAGPAWSRHARRSSRCRRRRLAPPRRCGGSSRPCRPA